MNKVESPQAQEFHAEMKTIEKATPERLALLKQKPDHLTNIVRRCFRPVDQETLSDLPTTEEMVVAVRQNAKLILELLKIDYRDGFEIPHEVFLEAAKVNGDFTVNKMKQNYIEVPEDVAEAALAQNPLAERQLLPPDEWTYKPQPKTESDK